MMMIPWFLNMGGYEILLIFGVVLILFGGKKIPELMRGIGKGIREFNTAKDNLSNELKEGMNKEETSSAEPRPAGQDKEIPHSGT